jgi:predicted nucleotidyltransferase
MEIHIASDFLESIHKKLAADARVHASWLIGSFGRGDQDKYSDIDLCIVVSDTGLLQDWSEFVTKFGEPVNTHEAKQNAPEGGTMASVLYKNGVTVDWMLIPLKSATRPIESRLLFEKEPIPIEPQPQDLQEDQRQSQLNDRITYFWMMAAVAAKSILRNHGVRFHVFMNMLFWIKEEIADLLSSENRPYLRFSGLGLMITQEDQTKGLRELCKVVVTLCKRPTEPAFEVINKMLELRRLDTHAN